MESGDDIRKLIKCINDLVSSGNAAGESDDFWRDAGARLLIFIDQLVKNSEAANTWTPKEYSEKNICIFEAVFNILSNLTSVNQPFKNDIWEGRQRDNPESVPHDENGEPSDIEDNMISFYELAFSRCCSLLCQLLGDRFSYIQKLLIKNLFSSSNVCSLFASDMYMFTLRIIHPHQSMAMCQIIMNLCKLAPPEAMVKAVALINRIKHPIVNFENPKYQYLLDFS